MYFPELVEMFRCLLVGFFHFNGNDLAGRGVLDHKKLFTERPVLSAQIDNYVFPYCKD